MYVLSHELPNDLWFRILENEGISVKSLKCLDLMVSTQPANQKPNFEAFR